jgi:hypothetical protein
MTLFMHRPIMSRNLACHFLITAVIAAHCCNARAVAFITLRTSQALSDEQQSALAQVAQDTTRTVPVRVDPYSIVRGFCGGSFTHTYFSQVKQRNPGFVFGPSNKTRDLRLPACPKVSKNVTVSVLSGDTIDTILGRYLGIKSDQYISICDGALATSKETPATGSCVVTAREAVAALNGGKSAGLDDLTPGRSLLLPTVTRSTTVALQTNVSISEALSQLQRSQASGNAIPVLHESPQLTLLQPLASDDPSIVGTICAPDGPALNRPWPFDNKLLENTIERSKARAKELHIDLIPTVVRVADTGAAGLGSYFPPEALSIDAHETADQPYDLDGNHFNGDRYGIDAAGEGQIGPYVAGTGEPNQIHGTAIADLALGGFTFRTDYPSVYNLIKIDFAKIFWKPGGGPISVNSSTMLSAMQSINNHQMPTVINFSVGGGNPNTTGQFVDYVLHSAELNFLVVLAAGNSGDDIENDSPIYPASYGGTGSAASDFIITVGASDPKLLATSFSNRSANRVDLLAPGCRIEFIAPSNEHQFLSGTSVATPLVSFAAALVHALGVSDIVQVKQRIIASANFDPANQSTRFHSVLNIPRSVALFQDTVQVRDDPAYLKDPDNFKRGIWHVVDGMAGICIERDIPATRVLRVDSYIDGSGSATLRILAVGSDRRISAPFNCRPNGNGIAFEDESGNVVPIPWVKLVSIVPAFHFPGVGQ